MYGVVVVRVRTRGDHSCELCVSHSLNVFVWGRRSWNDVRKKKEEGSPGQFTLYKS